MKKILICPDKFKSTFSAQEVANLLSLGIEKSFPKIKTIKLPLADGGEGTAQILTQLSKGKFHTKIVTNPLFRKIKAKFGISGNGKIAFIEMAEAAGLHLLNKEEQNPFKTTTYGVGELILEAIKLGVKKIILCIGGSATNDVGVGMAAALGYKFLKKTGESFIPTGKNLSEISQIDNSNLKANFSEIEFQTACDVNNPLYGKNGATHVFAQQKGAKKEDLLFLDKNLKDFSIVAELFFNKKISQEKGAGAAGGLGAGAMFFLDSKLISGTEIVLKESKFENYLKDCDAIITGEGKFDNQSIHGKLISGIIKHAKKHEIPVNVVCGICEISKSELEKIEINQIISLFSSPPFFKEIMKRTPTRLQAAARLIIRKSSL